MQRRAIVYALLSAALFGASTPLAKLLLGEVPPLLLAAIFYLGSGTGLLGWIAARRALILGAAVFVIGQIVYKVLNPSVPIFGAMGAVGFLSLLTNGTCLALLLKHRQEDVNMSSVWECSRNDIASNIAVILAAGAVWMTASWWPDLLIGSALALLFLWSAARVFRGALSVVHAEPTAR